VETVGGAGTTAIGETATGTETEIGIAAGPMIGAARRAAAGARAAEETGVGPARSGSNGVQQFWLWIIQWQRREEEVGGLGQGRDHPLLLD
ncbi:unnamed protein product, partial [Effrenium voratum]